MELSAPASGQLVSSLRFCSGFWVKRYTKHAHWRAGHEYVHIFEIVGVLSELQQDVPCQQSDRTKRQILARGNFIHGLSGNRRRFQQNGFIRSPFADVLEVAERISSPARPTLEAIVVV
ncbi:hypothetical protein K474DRAFT_1701750 [Panus rudis PR-1116 ss-1]|nr:hypothetical protein K474DRAFT_1701750 [Panus rudis PR-1116 ss-1]